MFLLLKRIAMGCVLVTVGFWEPGYVAAVDSPVMDKQYVKEHYPELYHQIYQEGIAAAQKEVAGGDVAEPAAPATSAPAAAEAPPAKPGLGAWWEKNALKYTPLPQQWLFHVEGTLDYKHKTGNVESDLYNGSASLMVRKQRFTNTLTYIIGKESTQQASEPGAPPSETKFDYRSFQEILRYDLTDRLYTEGGYVWEKDTANYIEDRDSYYAGFGYALIDTPKHLLDVMVAGGYVEEKYPDLVKTAMNMDHGNVAAGYFRESYRWHITDRLTYKQTFRIIQDFSGTDVFNDDLMNLQVIDETHRYRWFLINEIYIKMIDHLSFMVGVKIDYDSNPWPTVEKRDTTIKSGIQFSF
ncbi:MAG: hypothetical protein VR64_18070 [Desulfatitalea sp. BRH_c12]|nr:MAG: hypothetical protein VR64_18070 [Desulfatitalea sp. BRH_c12]